MFPLTGIKVTFLSFLSFLSLIPQCKLRIYIACAQTHVNMYMLGECQS